MNTNEHHHDRPRLAFTLIEMLVVITIMAIVAAIVVSSGQSASIAKKKTQVKAELNRIATLIDNYQAKLNSFPPDNGLLVANTVNYSVYDAMAATNPLIYELIGATNTNSSMVVFNSINSANALPTSEYEAIFNRGGIANADNVEPHNFFQPGPSTKEYSYYASNAAPIVANPFICGLVVPAESTNHLPVSGVVGPNFFRYDSSTTNRHNLASYDLWAEFTIGNKGGIPIMITNGNW
jgi:prepilin-type N-terminal cleavage/methylation domain-containing protein